MYQPDSTPAEHNHFFPLPKTMISALLHKTCKEKQVSEDSEKIKVMFNLTGS